MSATYLLRAGAGVDGSNSTTRVDHGELLLDGDREYESNLNGERVELLGMGIPEKDIQRESFLLMEDSLPEAVARSLAAMDTKSLYISLKWEERGKEPRVASAVAEIKQSMSARSCVPRCCATA